MSQDRYLKNYTVQSSVIPAEAGIHNPLIFLDSRSPIGVEDKLRGNDDLHKNGNDDLHKKKKRNKWGGFLFSLGLILFLGCAGLARTSNSNRQLAILYTSNTSGFTEPSG